MSSEGAVPDRPAATHNRNWLWFFVILVALAVAAVGINWSYNLRQQLTLEKLTAAEELWKKNGPANYDLTIVKDVNSKNADQPLHETIEVKVRQKSVLAGTLDGRPLEPRVFSGYDMPSWFDFIETYLKQDRDPGAPRTFCTAVFDPHTGGLIHFLRRVNGTRERQELTFEVRPVATP